MLLAFPFLPWLALLASVASLGALWHDGETRPAVLAGLLTAVALAAWCQFGSASPIVNACGLAAQTLLAIGLVIRVRIG